MIDERAVEIWNDELEELFLRAGHRFRRVEPRRRMRDYIRGLLGPVGRKNGWQLAGYAGHRTPDRLQRLLNSARWDADELRDDLQHYVAERLGEPDGILILDDTGFLKKGTTCAGVQRQYSGTAGTCNRSDFDHLVAVSEPYWDALAEAAFQRRFHRPRSYLHPQTSSLDHYHRILTALLRRRRAATSTLLAHLLGVTRTNLSNQFQDGHRLLDLHKITVTPLPGASARTLEQLNARGTPLERHPTDQN